MPSARPTRPMRAYGAVLLLALSACGASALQRSSAGGRTQSAGAPAMQRARRVARNGRGMTTTMSAASGPGMSKEEVDAYVAKVKAETDTVARARGEGAAGGVTVGDGGIDFGSLVKYPVVTAMEVGIIAALFKGLDAVGGLPAVLVPPLFAFLSLRSRVFSLLSAKRPPRGGFEDDGKRVATPADTKRPSWTPPGFMFPIIWLSITALRSISAFIIWNSTGRTLCSAPLLALVTHLCIGDTWNSITNVERRLGVSCLGVLFVVGSVYNVIYRFYEVKPLAGLILAPSGLWISIATVLTWSIWSMNGKQSLLPRKDGKAGSLQIPILGALMASK